VHKEKLEVLEEIVDTANGKPVLVAYSYRHDMERIMKHLKGYSPEVIKSSDSIQRWNKKQVPVMLAHPASAGHGLNLQAGGNIVVWFGLIWSLELYQQFVKRLDRQGQIENVINNRLIAKGTMDYDVLQALDDKSVGQERLLCALKARVEKYVSVRA
jgi:SNF2 family DNA or RNA helicase